MMNTFSTRKTFGFTLVELLIALTLGLLLTASFGSVLISNKQSFRAMDATSRVQETGRYAMHLLTRDLRSAGYQGCAGLSANITNTLNAGTLSNLIDSTPLQGYDHKTAGSSAASAWLPSLDASISGAAADSDVVMIRSSISNGVQLTATMPTTAAALQISAASTIDQGDIFMVCDCRSSCAIAQRTNVNNGTNALVHNAGGAVTPGNAVVDMGKRYGPESEVMEVENRSWYVGTGASGEPALFLEANDSGGIEMVEGIESLQLLFGEDTNNNDSANRYLTADLITNWNNVVSVRVFVVARTAEDNIASDFQTYTVNGANVTATDKRIRRVFSATINLRNSTVTNS